MVPGAGTVWLSLKNEPKICQPRKTIWMVLKTLLSLNRTSYLNDGFKKTMMFFSANTNNLRILCSIFASLLNWLQRGCHVSRMNASPTILMHSLQFFLVWKEKFSRNKVFLTCLLFSSFNKFRVKSNLTFLTFENK